KFSAQVPEPTENNDDICLLSDEPINIDGGLYGISPRYQNQFITGSDLFITLEIVTLVSVNATYPWSSLNCSGIDTVPLPAPFKSYELHSTSTPSVQQSFGPPPLPTYASMAKTTYVSSTESDAEPTWIPYHAEVTTDDDHYQEAQITIHDIVLAEEECGEELLPPAAFSSGVDVDIRFQGFLLCWKTGLHDELNIPRQTTVPKPTENNDDICLLFDEPINIDGGLYGISPRYQNQFITDSDLFITLEIVTLVPVNATYPWSSLNCSGIDTVPLPAPFKSDELHSTGTPSVQQSFGPPPVPTYASMAKTTYVSSTESDAEPTWIPYHAEETTDDNDQKAQITIHDIVLAEEEC
ncbi:hypothetical protein J6590_107348, partial [Homalodisca vitripennis]